MAKIGIIGSGGRENALAWKLDGEGHEVYSIPGNGGSSRHGTPVPIDVNDFAEIATFAKKEAIDLVIVTPDDQLAAGGVDFLRDAGICAFGPTREAAKIEWSKLHAKNLMDVTRVLTAPWRGFLDEQYEEALHWAMERPLPFMVKKSGPALGKGAKRCFTREDAQTALHEIMVEKKHGPLLNSVVIEDFVLGDELSMHVLTDGTSVAVRFPAARDYKQVNDGDKGDNTGSMGTVVPLPGVEGVLDWAMHRSVLPVLDALQDSGSPFSGLLYPGLMVGKDGHASVLEYNARFGDSECQAYMRLLESDLYPVLKACTNGSLASGNLASLKWHSGSVVCVNLVSGGYPNEYKKGFPIKGIARAEMVPGAVVFHAGTKYQDGTYYTNGGRVLNVTAWGETLPVAISRAYEAAERISFEGMHYRRDIGANV